MKTLADYFRAAELPEATIPCWGDNLIINPDRIPVKHQIEDLNQMARHTRFGLYSDPGVGKTIPMQAYGLWLVGQGNKVIYTLPPALIEQFIKSLEFVYPGYSQYCSLRSFQMSPKAREAFIKAAVWPDILVMSYVMFLKHHHDFTVAGYTALVVDEATVAKSPSSQIHKCIKIFAGKPGPESNGVVLVTGTPVMTNVIDSYGLIAIINPNRYGSYRGFLRAHCIQQDFVYPYERKDGSTGIRTESKIVGYKNLDYLHHSLFAQGRRVLKSEVRDLPPRVITEIQVALSKPHRELYRKLVDERLAEIGDRVIDMTTASALYQGLQQVIMNPFKYTDQEFTHSVLDALDTLLETLEGHKVVIYCWYTHTVEQLLARYASKNPAHLYGKTGQNREAQRQKFLTDDTCRLMIANPRSGGVGVDELQKVCSYIVCAEVFPFPGLFQQAMDRLHRTGQTETVNVYLLVALGTIATKLRNDLIRKDAEQEQVVRDKRTVLRDLLGDEGIKGVL